MHTCSHFGSFVLAAAKTLLSSAPSLHILGPILKEHLYLAHSYDRGKRARALTKPQGGSYRMSCSSHLLTLQWQAGPTAMPKGSGQNAHDLLTEKGD